VNFISTPVNAGFISAGLNSFPSGFISVCFFFQKITKVIRALIGILISAALTIISTQLKSLLGLKFHAEGFIPTLSGIMTNITKTQSGDAILSLACITSLLLLMVFN